MFLFLSRAVAKALCFVFYVVCCCQVFRLFVGFPSFVVAKALGYLFVFCNLLLRMLSVICLFSVTSCCQGFRLCVVFCHFLFAKTLRLFVLSSGM